MSAAAPVDVPMTVAECDDHLEAYRVTLIGPMKPRMRTLTWRAINRVLDIRITLAEGGNEKRDHP